MGHSLAKGLDAGGRAVLTAAGADVDVGGAGEAALDVILDLCMLNRKSENRLERMYLRGTLCSTVSSGRSIR
jgi:hypothetical protein